MFKRLILYQSYSNKVGFSSLVY